MISFTEESEQKYISHERLVELRVSHARCTQEELATTAGVSQANIAAMESGKRPITAKMFKRLATAADQRAEDYTRKMNEAKALADEVFARPHLVALRQRNNQGGQDDDE